MLVKLEPINLGFLVEANVGTYPEVIGKDFLLDRLQL